MTRYRTVVVDPPWPIKDSGPRTLSTAGQWEERHVGTISRVPYQTMTLAEIASLPVGDLAERDAHLYVWTINAYVEQTYEIVRGWGFKASTLLTWCKAPRGIGFGGSYVNTTEFILFARRGSLAALSRVDSTWWQFKRPYDENGAVHSQKPDGFLDVVEQVSPAPRLELFARRARFGWDYWGDESLGTVAMAHSEES